MADEPTVDPGSSPGPRPELPPPGDAPKKRPSTGRLRALLESEHDDLTVDALRDLWPILLPDERVDGLRGLSHTDAEEFFRAATAADQASTLLAFPAVEQRAWLALLQPDDVADLLQAAPEAERERLLGLLNEQTRQEVRGLLAYAEDHAGGLMHTRYARLRPEATVEEAISYLRRQTREKVELLYYAYVLDAGQRLVGVVSLRELLSAPSKARISEVMTADFVTVPEEMDQEAVSRVFAEHDLLAIPVVDAERRMKGIVTIDDVVDVVQEEATEDAQKFGGMQALDAPYLSSSLWTMLRRRGVWLALLLVGEMLTTSAMARYEDEIAKAVVLALFVPLIISSGGNSGSQASTLVIRAMALGEVHLRDWWRVVRRELWVGLLLGAFLGAIGLLRVVAWHGLFQAYGDHWLPVGLTVAVSLTGVVAFGTLVGSMLPFGLHRLGLDPASASAPFVATLVDVTGLIIYFSVASVLLRGTLL